MNVESMVRHHVSRRTKTPNLLIVPVDRYTVDVFNNHDYREWSRYGSSKGRWHFQKGTRLNLALLKEMVDGISRKN